MFLISAVLPSMIKRQQGKIVYVSSVQGKFAIPYRSAYSGKKQAYYCVVINLLISWILLSDKNVIIR